MSKESRIIISGLSEEAAIKMLPQLRREPLSRGAKFELDHPDPPSLLEKEYRKVNDAFDSLSEFANRSGEWEWSDSTTKREVARDLSRLRKQQAKLEGLFTLLRDSIDALEAGLKKLK